MTDEDIRRMLREEASGSPTPRGISPRTVRRARVRRVSFLSFSTIAVLAVGGLTFLGAGVIARPTPSMPPSVSDGPALGVIAFERYGSGGGIYVMNSDGSGAHRILDSEGHAIGRVAWSPNGTQIAFHGFFGEANNEAGGLFLMNSDGSDIRLLALGGAEPDWSPDGKEIAYYNSNNGFLSIIAVDGGVPITPTKQVAGMAPDWSPDGSTIAAVEHSGDGIFLMDRDGNSLRTLIPSEPLPGESHLSTIASDPQWSPDGSSIAFTSGDELGNDVGHLKVETVNPDGTHRKVLADGYFPTWSPDGQTIAFVRKDGQTTHLYSMHADGTGLRQLTFGEEDDHSPAWAPAQPDESRWRWAAIPAAPLDPFDHSDVKTFWTGDALLVIEGGSGGPEGTPKNAMEGALFDPTTGTWKQIATSPLKARNGYAAVWSGEEMIVWGGVESRAVNDGAAYDPITDRWRLIAPSPLEARNAFIAEWTGSEMIIQGGGECCNAGNADRFFADGAAYDPETDSWRKIAPDPEGWRASAVSVWTGSQVLVWGGVNSDGLSAGGSAYDPSIDTWSKIENAPLEGRVNAATVWTGKELIVWGGSSLRDDENPTFGDGAAYDPMKETWRSLAPSPLSPRQLASHVWTGTRAIFWGGTEGEIFEGAGYSEKSGAVYDPELDQWEMLPL
ncbi:MAG: hypothetical protein QOH90_1383, partial [Actinomycetota bacterium]|nr:hypothetical protein [Actinomycetota bacterium]